MHCNRVLLALLISFAGVLSAPQQTTTAAGAADLTINSYVDPAIELAPGVLAPISITIASATSGVLPASMRLTETVPAGAAFDAAASNVNGITWSCANGSGAGTSCATTIAPANLTGGWLNAPFAVQLNDPFPTGQLVITNTMRVSAAGSRVAASGISVFNVNLSRTQATKSQRQIVDLNGNGKADPGDVIQYTIRMTNTGTRAADLTLYEPQFVNDPAPANFPWFLEILTPTATASQGTLTFPEFSAQSRVVRAAFGSVAPGAGAALHVQARVRSEIPAYGDVATNQAVVEIVDPGRSYDWTFYKATNMVSATLSPRVDLALTYSTSRFFSKPETGASQIDVYVSNGGPSTATGVSISQTIPTGVSIDTAHSTPGWTCNGRRCTFPIGELAGASDPSGYNRPGRVISFTLKPTAALPADAVRADVVGEVVHTTQQAFDAMSSNNTSMISVPIGERPKLVASQYARFVVDGRGDGLWETGDIVEYTINITNTSATRAAGDVQAYWRELYDERSTPSAIVLPEFGTISQGTSTGPAAQIGTLNPGQSVTFTLRAALGAAPPRYRGRIQSFVLLTDHYPPYPGHTSARPIDIPAFYAQNVAWLKSIDTGPMRGVAQDSVTFTIVITNTGVAPLNDWILQDFGYDTPHQFELDARCAEPIANSLALSGPIGPGEFVTVRKPFTVDPEYQQVLSVSLASLAPGQSGSASVRASIPTGCAEVSNAARIDTQTGTLLRSNRVSAPVFGARSPILTTTVRSADGFDDLIYGERVTITVDVFNAGSAPIENLARSVSAYWCIAFDPASIRISNGRYALSQSTTPIEVAFEFGTLPVGSSASATVVAYVIPGQACDAVTIIERQRYETDPQHRFDIPVGSLHARAAQVAPPVWIPTATPITPTPVTTPGTGQTATPGATVAAGTPQSQTTGKRVQYLPLTQR
jgi:hypothetical protein